jgi:hypothetical protein
LLVQSWLRFFLINAGAAFELADSRAFLINSGAGACLINSGAGFELLKAFYVAELYFRSFYFSRIKAIACF